MKISGLQKTSLLDYPGMMCCTIFTKGCNLRCPFCHNASLVLDSVQSDVILEQEIFAYLKKRRGLLDGVCISGGEPMFQKGLKELIQEIRAMGYLVKLDTNGCYPDQLKELVQEGLVDYIAMDIKNSWNRYSETVGIADFDTAYIRESAEFLMKGQVDYEFRTTIVKEFHTKEDILEIGDFLSGAKNYYLQGFVDSGDLILKDLHEVSEETMQEYRKCLLSKSVNAVIRGL